jgi:endonuclease/exonuclease/phosphatase family metal-dependent hydrolase
MRLVSWNVCDAFRSKFGHLERLRPDIAVLQEVRPDCLKFAALEGNSFWIGDPGQKGLAAIAYNGWTLSEASFPASERWFLPLRATNGSTRVNVVAVWVDSAKDCVPPTLRAIEHLREFLADGPCVIAGDFNQSVHFDKGKGAGRRFASVLQLLESYGFGSVWHQTKGEAHGEETEATLFWTWNKERRFHIDFAFASEAISVEDVSLGSFEQYVSGRISDHVPLVVDFAVT